MSLFCLAFSFVTCIFLIFTYMEFTIEFKKIKNLKTQISLATPLLPKISIIVSALNEEKEIADALTSLLTLDYPALEVIAINDRSTDSTPQILNDLHQQFAELKVYHIKTLPSGWIGKNHALHVGSQAASGEWLLFTDADIVMHKGSLKKAISYALVNQLDHLTLYENHLAKNFWLRVFLLANYMTQTMFVKPWNLRKPHSKTSHGNGAFNLIKKSSYKLCGGHTAIAMQCLDDIHLGKIIKKNNFKQDIVDGQDLVEREWYKSLFDMIKGLKKNSFSFFKYNLFLTITVCTLALGLYILPVILVFYTQGVTQLLTVINIALTFGISRIVSRHFRLPRYIAFFYPLSICFLIYTIGNSVLATYRNNGVIWRGTHYSLKELKGMSS